MFALNVHHSQPADSRALLLLAVIAKRHLASGMSTCLAEYGSVFNNLALHPLAFL